MTNKIALNTVRWAFLLSFFGLSSAAEAQNLPSAPRDFFIGQCERWNNGDTFFPDKILFEADPENLSDCRAATQRAQLSQPGEFENLSRSATE